MVLSMYPKTDQVASNAGTSTITVEVPTDPASPFNPFDPAWIKMWEQTGPIAYLVLLCLFVWLLTRLVQTVKGK
jgi:hypothetical protein